MRRPSKALFLGLFLFLGACAQFQPFIDSRREAGTTEPVGQSTPDRIAVCYNGWWNDSAEVERLAEEGCAATNRKPVADGRKLFNCRLLTPTTAFFKCK